MNESKYTGCDRDIEIQIMIEKYIKGELQSNQEDLLWIEFLKAPDRYDYFITLLNLHALIKRTKVSD